MKANKLFHGADYNPEQWLDRPDILHEDIRLMKEAHINVVSLGIFAWSTLEPEEGRFELDWLAEIIDNLYAAGINVDLATPSAARPAWMAYKYPEVRRVDSNRVRQLYGKRHNHCYTSPIYRQKVKLIDQELARRFGNHPGVILWHISNEMGGDCHCPLCQAAFQSWLQKRYGSLTALNKAWNTKFWSHDYTDWTQIESPASHGEDTMQGLLLDWKRFVTHQTLDFYRWERNCIREIIPQAECTINMMYRFDGLDYTVFAPEVDLVSWDNYPQWHKCGTTDTDIALDTAMMHDLYYSLKGKPFWMMESTPSVTNWQSISKVKKPGMQMMSDLQAIAHGADAAMYFQWRQSVGAFEKFHGAVVGHDGKSSNRVFRETAAVGQVLETLSGVAGTKKPKQAAIVHDWNNKWALENSMGPRNAGMGYWDEIALHYNALAREGISVDFISETSDLSEYRLIIAPMLYLLQENFAQKLQKFTENGGTLVVTYWSGIVNENDLCWLGNTPHGLVDTLGICHQEIDSMYDDETRRCISSSESKMAEVSCGTLCEVSSTTTAEPLLQYDEDFFKGAPALTRNHVGKGQAYYMATRFETSFYRDFYRDVCKSLFQLPWENPLPDGVLATFRGNWVFLQNTNSKSVVLEGRTLPAYATLIFENDQKTSAMNWRQKVKAANVFFWNDTNQ